MSATIVDGKILSSQLRERIAAVAGGLSYAPGLATVLVGENPASLSYITSKQRACADAGFHAEDIRLPEDAGQERLIATVRALNSRSDIHGILVQMPLPDGHDEEAVVACIDPEKDVDGFHPVNLGMLLRGERCFVPCTPYGVIMMLALSGVETSGRDVVIVGRSLLVGKPLAALLMQKSLGDGRPGANATVTVCHSATRDIAQHTRRADIVIVAIGRAGFLTADMVKDGAVVVDVGINRVPDDSRKRGYRVVGDVDFEAVKEKASAITPVPGGVGQLTVTMLLHNTLQASRGLRSQDPL